MTKTEQKSLRLTPATAQQIDELSQLWSSRITGRPLSVADVVTVCVFQVHQTETKKQEKRR